MLKQVCGGVSASRFGKISPRWPKVNRPWQAFKALFSIWQHFVAKLANFMFLGKFSLL